MIIGMHDGVVTLLTAQDLDGTVGNDFIGIHVSSGTCAALNGVGDELVCKLAGENFIACLHDCIAEKAYFKDGVLGFEFSDGFWILPNHPESHLSKTVRTNFSKVEFIRSAANPSGFLRDGRPQFAFAGRSNVGKSSVINRLVNRKNMAYVGASPGKTTQINYFRIDQKAYLVDLPGYGYAKVSQAEKERWGRLMESYFQDGAEFITIGVLIVDIRHKPTANDIIMHDWFRQTGCPEIILANKLDKLKKSQVEPALAVIRETLLLDEEDILIPFSAEKGAGKDELIGILSQVCN
jgi:GTP-binding protein